MTAKPAKRCFMAIVAANDLLVLVDQDWRIEAERFDAPGDRLNLGPTVLARISRIRFQLFQTELISAPGAIESTRDEIRELVRRVDRHFGWAHDSPQDRPVERKGVR
jgi:hypothetical protein